MPPSIQFPLVKKLEVDGYQLYPGDKENAGLHQSFSPGVSVIIGVNGLGKTTLLRILLRLLTGPRDLRAGDEIGGTQRELSKSIDTGEFARRVPDQAASAVATLTFEIGDRTLVVKRSLKDLKLLSFSVAPEQPELPRDNDLEVTYQLAIMGLAGLVDFFDFVFLLRHVVFFLEDRRGLVWDRWAQTELLQIYLLPHSRQREYRAALSEALSADSAARGTHAVLKREKTRLAKIITAAAKSPTIELNLLRTEVENRRAQLEAIDNDLDVHDAGRREQRRLAESRRHDSAVLAQRERGLREGLLATIFPTLTDYGALALSYIERGHGCIVCGSTDVAHLAAVAESWIAKGACPVCASPKGIQEERVEGMESAITLEELRQERRRMAEAAAAADIQANSIHEQYMLLSTKRDRLVTELFERSELLRVRDAAAKVSSPDRVTEQDERVRVLEEAIADDRATKAAAVRRVSEVVEELRSDIVEFQTKMCEAFSGFIRAFLSEHCELGYRVSGRRIGQSSDDIEVEFPEFYVRMTSGVFRIDSEIRESPSSVSESQREFIELAFRMAFLSIAAEASPCTLILDTPEASLDAVFIPRAGKAFNGFAYHPNSRRVLLAASNLNGTAMIPSMLGHIDRADLEGEVATRVLNLLGVAARGKAFDTYANEYESALATALKLTTL